MQSSHTSTLDHLRRALRYLSADRWRLALLMGLIVLVAIPLTLTEPFLIQLATQQVVLHRDLKPFLAISGLALLYYGARFSTELVLNYFGLHLAYRIHVRILQDSLQNFLGKDLSVVKSLPRGDLLYCLFNDTLRVAGFVFSDLTGLYTNILLLLGCFGLMLYFNVRLALICLVFFALLFLFQIRFAGILLQRQTAIRRIDQDLSGRIQNMLSGIVTLKVFRLLSPVLGQWIERYRPRWRIEINMRMIETALGSGAGHAHIIFTFFILFLGFQQGSIVESLGTIFAFLVLYGRMAIPIHYLIGFFLGFQETRAALKRYYWIYDLRDRRSPALASAEAPSRGAPETLLRCLQLHRATVLRGDQRIRLLDLELEPGRSYLLAGPNGSGKTTTGLVLAGLLPMVEGEYRFKEMPGIAPYVACRIIYLEKEGYWPAGTIAENCELSHPDSQLDQPRLERCLEICQCAQLIDSLPLGIRNPIAMDWNLISDGECQRLFLAFAMYHQPQVLILDEALSHIPFDVRRRIVPDIRAARPDLLLILMSQDVQDRELADSIIDLPTRPGARFSAGMPAGPGVGEDRVGIGRKRRDRIVDPPAGGGLSDSNRFDPWKF